MFLKFLIIERINRINHLFRSLVSVLRANLLKGVIRGTFWALFFKIDIFEFAIFFSCLVVIQSILNYQNAYGHQTSQSGDLLLGAFTHKYAWHLNAVVSWGLMTSKIHIFTRRKSMDTKLGKVLT